MKKTNNSFSSILEDFMIMYNNIISILSGITEMVITNKDEVVVNIKNTNNKIEKFRLPSIGKIMLEINKLNENIKNLINNNSSTYIELNNNEYKRIYYNKIEQTPINIQTLSLPTTFSYKMNYFFENFTNPNLIIQFNFSELISQYDEISKILVRRIIINNDDEKGKILFDNIFKNRNNILFEEAISVLQNNNVNFYIDDNEIQMSPNELQYYGLFDVLKIEEFINKDNNVRFKYYLNTLRYNDRFSNINETMELKIGDKLIYKDSLYVIEEINIEEKSVVLRNVFGFDVISEGPKCLKFYNEKINDAVIDINISYDEREIIFIKTVNLNNILSLEWSYGVAFYSNELVMNINNKNITLEDFYKLYVDDYSLIFKNILENRYIPREYGIQPLAPILNSENFKVVQINEHKFSNNLYNEIKKKNSEKVTLLSEINSINIAINEKKNEFINAINLTEYQKTLIQNELNNLFNEKEKKINLYYTLIKEIESIIKDNNIIGETPKYRIRGFFDIPAPQYHPKTGYQYPIQFLIEYRYIRYDGNASDTKSFEYIDNNGNKKIGYYSNWIQVKSDIRKRIFDYITNRYIWNDENTINPEEININQIDIPITKNEGVEIRVKSISECGYPLQPLMSEYSNTITIFFPQELNVNNEIEELYREINIEKNKLEFQKELDNYGLSLHTRNSFLKGDKYYSHSSEEISSGFYTQEGNIINLYEKIKSIDSELKELKNIIETKPGKLRVYIIDENNNEIDVLNNNTVKIFAGFYKDIVENLPQNERRGYIVNKVYKLCIENIENGNIELYTRFINDISDDLPNTEYFEKIDENDIPKYYMNTINTYLEDKNYNMYKKYDQVPFLYSSISEEETTTASKISSYILQSQQLNKQFLYQRYKSINSLDDLYSYGYEEENINEQIKKEITIFKNKDTISNYLNNLKKYRFYLPIIKEDQSNQIKKITNIWNGKKYEYDENTKTDNLNEISTGEFSNFCIHIDHPLVKSGKSLEELLYPEIVLDSFVEDPVYGQIPISKDKENVILLQHSKYFNIPYNHKNGIQFAQKQLNYSNNWFNITEERWKKLINEQLNKNNESNISKISELKFPFTITSDVLKTQDFYVFQNKQCFHIYDKYLVGKNTCGCYLSIMPMTPYSLLTDNDNRKKVYYGKNNRIEIPILFQYRMCDYYPEGDGIIGGYDENSQTQWIENNSLKSVNYNLTYSKKIGLDLYIKGQEIFTFDIEITAKYRKDNISQSINNFTAVSQNNFIPIDIEKQKIAKIILEKNKSIGKSIL